MFFRILTIMAFDFSDDLVPKAIILTKIYNAT